MKFIDYYNTKFITRLVVLHESKCFVMNGPIVIGSGLANFLKVKKVDQFFTKGKISYVYTP